MKRKALIILLVLAVTFALIPLSSGENIDQEPFQSQVVADYILIGKVINIESRWNDDRTTIYSYVTISVENWLTKSCLDEKITIKYIGGEVDGLVSRRSDQPSFSMDERIKVFLKLEETGEFTVAGGGQGKISLRDSTSSSYSYSGIHWHSNSIPVKYYINKGGTPDITDESEFTAVQRAFQTWEDDPGSYMDYTYMGTTNKSSDIYDGYNVVFWKYYDGPGKTLGYCHYWYYKTSKELVDFDIVFDEAETWSTTGEPTKFDVQNLGTHEVGHTLVLNDLYDSADSEETMYGYASAGETKKRTLNAGDMAGIRYIYPGSGVTYTIATNPTGLQVKVDGDLYTAPKSFGWYPQATHTIDAPSPQSGDTGVRYVYTSWSDGGAQSRTITVGASDTTITANFKTQYLVTFQQSGSGGTPHVTVDGTTHTLPYSLWPDAGSSHSFSYESQVSGGTAIRYLQTSTSHFSPITVTSSITITGYYKTQYQLSFKFMTHGPKEIRPTQIKIFGTSPNNTLIALKSYSNIWLDNVKWTAKQILWMSNNVVPDPNPQYSPTAGGTWIINCRAYLIDFTKPSFKDSRGVDLPIEKSPLFFKLACPNGTITSALSFGSYYLQNGTYQWKSIVWRGIDVVPSPPPTFDPTDGNPAVNCRVYPLTVYVKDYLTLAVSGADVGIYLPDGTLFTSGKSGAGGDIVFSQLPISDYKVEVTFLGLKTGAALSLTSDKTLEIKVLLSLPTLVIVWMVVGIVIVSSVVVHGGRKKP